MPTIITPSRAEQVRITAHPDVLAALAVWNDAMCNTPLRAQLAAWDVYTATLDRVRAAVLAEREPTP